tara:strand:+ start:410 stop:991 length:582 start_codon:yes stop_codon:yes gene_type:complete
LFQALKKKNVGVESKRHALKIMNRNPHSQRFFWGARALGDMVSLCGIDLVQGYRKIVVPSAHWEMVVRRVNSPQEAHRLVHTHRAFYQRHLGLTSAELCFGYQMKRHCAPMQGAAVFRPIFTYARGRRVGLVCSHIHRAAKEFAKKWAPLRRQKIVDALFFGLQVPTGHTRRRGRFKLNLPAEIALLIATFAY